MSPFYHLVLPFDKFIVLDADIEFKSSPELLHSQFSKFMPGQVAGVAKDMSQLYRPWNHGIMGRRFPDGGLLRYRK